MLSQDSVDIAGEYRSTRSIYNHVDRVISFPGKGNFRITQAQSNTISIQGQEFYQIEPLVFSTLDGTNTLIFHQDGKSIHMHASGNPLFAYERVRWYETSTFNLLAFAICYVLLLTFTLAAIIGIVRRNTGVNAGSHLPRIARIWSVILSVVFLLVPVVTIFYTKVDLKSPIPILHGDRTGDSSW